MAQAIRRELDHRDIPDENQVVRENFQFGPGDGGRGRKMWTFRVGIGRAASTVSTHELTPTSRAMELVSDLVGHDGMATWDMKLDFTRGNILKLSRKSWNLLTVTTGHPCIFNRIFQQRFFFPNRDLPRCRNALPCAERVLREKGVTISLNDLDGPAPGCEWTKKYDSDRMKFSHRVMSTSTVRIFFSQANHRQQRADVLRCLLG